MSGRRLGSRVRGAVRALLAFLFSNVGVVILLVGYTIAGAFMFQAIEGASEWERANNMSLERAKMADHLWRITLSLNPFNGSTLNDSISVELYRYQRRVVTAVRRGWDGGRSSRQWSFSSSFLYSLTVITTIGYGHLSPRTSWGKIVTIFYTLLGMPLFLLYLTNVGELLARWFKCLYALVCLCRGCPGFSRRRRLQLDFSEAESIERPEDWPSSITDHSSEYGRRHMALDHRIAPIHKIPGPRIPGYRIPDYTVPRHRIPGYRIQELRRMPLDHRLYRDERIPGYGDIELQQMPRKPVFTRSQSMPQPRRLPPSPQRAAPALPAPENSRSSQFSIVSFDAQTITVPISVCVCILVGYIMFGSMLFGMWEKWDQLDGAYFCFISLSSIGFGDFVPGERVYTPRIETSFIACSFYLMLGMALVAMCFNLMQEQVIHYFAGLKRALKRICRCKR